MELITIAQKIPASVRKTMLEDNYIYKAVPVATDVQMKQLFIIWKNYIDPNNHDLSMECNRCLNRILNNFKELQPALLKIQKEESLYDL